MLQQSEEEKFDFSSFDFSKLQVEKGAIAFLQTAESFYIVPSCLNGPTVFKESDFNYNETDENIKRDRLRRGVRENPIIAHDLTENYSMFKGDVEVEDIDLDNNRVNRLGGIPLSPLKDNMQSFMVELYDYFSKNCNDGGIDLIYTGDVDQEANYEDDFEEEGEYAVKSPIEISQNSADFVVDLLEEIQEVERDDHMRPSNSMDVSSVDIAQQTDQRSSARTTSNDDLGFTAPLVPVKPSEQNLEDFNKTIADLKRQLEEERARFEEDRARLEEQIRLQQQQQTILKEEKNCDDEVDKAKRDCDDKLRKLQEEEETLRLKAKKDCDEKVQVAEEKYNKEAEKTLAAAANLREAQNAAAEAENAKKDCDDRIMKLQEEENARLLLEQEKANELAMEKEEREYLEEQKKIDEANAAKARAEKDASDAAAAAAKARLAEAEEEARLAAEELERARLAAEEARKKAEEEEEARIKAEQESRLAAEEEDARIKAEQESRLAAEEEEKARIKAEELEKARIAAEKEEARLKEQEEIERQNQIARDKQEQEEKERIEAEKQKAILEATPAKIDLKSMIERDKLEISNLLAELRKELNPYEIINEINLKAWSGLQKSPTTIDRVDLEIQWENNSLVNKWNKIETLLKTTLLTDEKDIQNKTEIESIIENMDNAVKIKKSIDKINKYFESKDNIIKEVDNYRKINTVAARKGLLNSGVFVGNMLKSFKNYNKFLDTINEYEKLKVEYELLKTKLKEENIDFIDSLLRPIDEKMRNISDITNKLKNEKIKNELKKYLDDDGHIIIGPKVGDEVQCKKIENGQPVGKLLDCIITKNWHDESYDVKYEDNTISEKMNIKNIKQSDDTLNTGLIKLKAGNFPGGFYKFNKNDLKDDDEKAFYRLAHIFLGPEPSTIVSSQSKQFVKPRGQQLTSEKLGLSGKKKGGYSTQKAHNIKRNITQKSHKKRASQRVFRKLKNNISRKMVS